MSRMPNPSANENSRRQLLVWSLCVLTIGLLAWRCVTIFTSPPTPLSSHPLSEVVSTIVGSGNAQISETASGDLLVLLNGPVGPVEPLIAQQLTDILQAISPTGSAPVLKQFHFAESTGFTPTDAELVELSVFGLLASLAISLAFATGRTPQIPDQGSLVSDQAHPPPTMSSLATFFEDAPQAPPFDTGPQPASVHLVRSEPGPHSLVDAQRFAESNPDVTAKVIEHWIRARGFEE